ncbi:MAG: hypothetical protein ACI857_001416 [Arenicella sp.]|jgi:hypothetical protein
MFIALFGVAIRIHVHQLLRKKIKIDIVNSLVILLWALGAYYAIQYYSSSELQRQIYFDQIVAGNFPEAFVNLNNLFMGLMSIYFIDIAVTIFRKDKAESKTFSNLFIQSKRYAQKFWRMIVSIYIVIMIAELFISVKGAEYGAIPIGLNIIFFFILVNLKH